MREKAIGERERERFLRSVCCGPCDCIGESETQLRLRCGEGESNRHQE